MNIKFRHFLIIFLLLLTFPEVSLAQGKVVAKIKKQMADLALDNYELKQQYEIEMQDVYVLKEKVDEKKEELKVFEANYQKRMDKISKRKTNLKYLYKKMDVVQSDILIQKGKVSFLKKKLLEVKKEHDLINLQLVDLKAQKKDLQGKLNDERFTSQKTEKELANKIIGLKMKVNTNISQQKKISELIIAIEENLYAYEQRKHELTRKTERLAGLLQEVRSKKDLQSRENLILSDKLLLAQKDLEGDIALRKEQKERISDEVKVMEVEYNDLTQSIEEALKWKEKKKKYHEEMVSIDKANAALREKIEDLRKKLERLER